MTKWIDIVPVSEFKPNTSRSITVDETEIAIFSLDDGFYAIEDACTHDYKTLSNGKIDGDQVICPWHGARFDIKTGEALTALAEESVATFPTRVENEMVQVAWTGE
uniref:3-phenylpropionate/trans-cinnamate dioxygenase ferredoxin subunit n=1 Tax=Candidatus Kentrum sp. MB TaxID=2138164 RepID=A0A450Y1Z6_9GAMM|nr:MAG: 3-phenylpropionate/trans-cinnamate dioxygenase ferredoxin subunit [Candidatus Kentron sp. MB]VFK77361.1 MAG: 3-phenylpropionate/trans-cinnamate dioxygenase ferredoxin subunit [Candidatus Kentron sp. MB]